MKGEAPEGTKGTYHSSSGKIFLVEGKWCFSTFIHESLHSRSSLSTLPDNFEFIYEGITEYLVGKILEYKFPGCFDEWCRINSCFSTAYIRYVKPWLYLDLKKLFEPIRDIYFDINDESPLEKIGTYLQEKLGGNFESIFNYENMSMDAFDNFIIMLENSFGSTFSRGFLKH